MPSGLREFFFNSEPQDDIISPADYAYLIMLRHLLSVISSWPLKILDPLDKAALRRRKIWVLIQRSFHMGLTIVVSLGCIMYILLHKKSMTFFELGHLYISQLMSCVVFSRLITLCFSDEYFAVGRTFLEKIHLFFYRNRSEYSMKTHKQVHRICHFFTICLTCQMFAGLSLFNLTPMYNNYSAGNYAKEGLKGNNTFEHALYFSYPFNASGNLKWYILANFFHWIISYIWSSWFCMHDCFLSLIVFHVWGHFKIILHNLDTFPRPTTKSSFVLENSNETLYYEMYTPEEQKRVSLLLQQQIEYHREIVDFINKISDVFGPMLFAYYGFHQASGCLLLLECSQMTAVALTRYLPLTLILFQQLIQLSVIFELIGSVSDRLKFAVYGLPWECMNTKNRKTVAFFLMNVQNPIHIKAMGLADVGITSMTKILKTSISFFTFLKSM